MPRTLRLMVRPLLSVGLTIMNPLADIFRSSGDSGRTKVARRVAALPRLVTTKPSSTISTSPASHTCQVFSPSVRMRSRNTYSPAAPDRPE